MERHQKHPLENEDWAEQVFIAIVVGRKIFLVADPAWLFCVDADDGKILWQKSNDFADLPVKVAGRHSLKEAGNTAPTPISDGQFVCVAFGSGIVACYDMQGVRQ